MTDNELIFKDYNAVYLDQCLTLFDKNCPKFFATNERQEYIEFLEKSPKNYKVGCIAEQVVAVFGLDIEPKLCQARITWIMTCPSMQTKGLGSKMMSYAKEMAKGKKVSVIDIAASHLSAPFFEKFGANKTAEIKDGWGQDMHRIDMELLL